MIDPKSVPVRFSNLKRIAQSPAHYLHGLTASYDSKAMRLGRLVHHLAFGTGGWTVYEGSRRGKAWETFEAARPGLEIYTADEASIATSMHASLMRDVHSRSLLVLNGSARIERTIEWTALGRACRGTPDKYDLSHVVDLKTTRCANPDWFVREATRMHYEAQLAWYSDAIEAAHGFRPAGAYIIAVESVAPYPVTVLRLTDRALEQGRKLARLWLERLLSCEAANEWPGYVQSVVDFDVPDPDEDPGLVFGDEDEDEEAA